MKIGGRIRQLREERKLTQEELADKTGFYTWHIQDLETGRAWPSWLDVLAIALVLNVGNKELVRPC